MPKFISNHEANKLRLKNQGKFTETAHKVDADFSEPLPTSKVEPDSYITKSISALAQGQLEIIKIQQQMIRPREWVFDIERDTEGRISKVKAKA